MIKYLHDIRNETVDPVRLSPQTPLMFPIKDHNPSTRTPYVTYGLIALNVLIFLISLPIANDNAALSAFYYDWANIPALVMQGEQTHTIVTSMFLHGGIMHLAGNMLFLWIFGDNLEDTFGHVGFLLFYLACGVLADAAHIASDPTSMIPTVGASGAIAGVMGGYLLLFPKAKVDVLLVLVVIFKRFTIPAWGVLIFWFGMQVFSGFGADTSGGGVAYWAHIGGFIAGAIITAPFLFRPQNAQFWKQNEGRPPHPAAEYSIRKTTIPSVKRRR